MFCNKCGREVSDNAKFCSYCGTQFDTFNSLHGTESAIKGQNKPLKRKINKKMLTIAAVAVVIVAVGITGYKLYTSSIAEMNRAIKSGNYSTALEIYEDELKYDELTNKTLELLNISLAELQAKYEAGALSYEEILERLGLLSNFGNANFNTEISAIRKSVENQHQVANLTAVADEYLQSEVYTAAIDNYNSALAIDPTAEATLAGLEQASNKYRAALLKDAAEYEEKGDYSSALNILEGGLSYLENDSELLNEIETLQARYRAYTEEKDVANTIEQVSQLLNDRLYDEALECINTALESYPYNETLLSVYNDTYTAIPELMLEDAVEYYSSDDAWTALWILAECREKYSVSQEAENFYEKIYIESFKAIDEDGYMLHYGGHLYCLFFDDSDPSYENIVSTWEWFGAHLATITSEQENAAIYEYLNKYGWKDVYFGLSDAEIEGSWGWCTGEPFTYSNWANGEPNGGTRENFCMYYHGSPAGTWNDGVFDPSTGYLVEWDTDFLK